MLTMTMTLARDKVGKTRETRTMMMTMMLEVILAYVSGSKQEGKKGWGGAERHVHKRTEEEKREKR